MRSSSILVVTTVNVLLSISCNVCDGIRFPSHPLNYSTIQVAEDVSLSVTFAGDEDGTPVVFLHGWPENSYSWLGMVDPLLQGNGSYRLVIPDQRGYNTSSKPKDKSAYGIPFLVNDVVELIKAVDPNNRGVVLVGHDWGGPVAWSVAGQHPTLISHLVIINGPHPSVLYQLLSSNPLQQNLSSYMLQFDELLFILPPFELVHMFKENAWFDDTTAKAYKTCWERPREIPASLNWYRTNVCGGCTAKTGGFTAASMAKSLLPRNLTITVPTLVIWGMKDTAFNNKANLDGLKAYVPHLTVNTADFANNTHWVAQESPEVVSKTILDWMQQEN